jgi:hypothetical protein
MVTAIPVYLLSLSPQHKKEKKGLNIRAKGLSTTEPFYSSNTEEGLT